MTRLPALSSSALPTIIGAAGEQAYVRFFDFFTANSLNPNTRKAYGKVAGLFLSWCEARGVDSLHDIQPIHVAAWMEEALAAGISAPTVKQHLAAIRALFDWMVVGQAMPSNPAASVRGPKLVVRRGKTPVLDPNEARHLLESIDTSKIVGLRDRALIGLMVYSFARIGAAVAMRVEDVYTQNRHLWVRLKEKGGKDHAVPCHHNLEAWIAEYIEMAGLAADRKGWLFRTIDRHTKLLSDRPIPQANAYQMIRRRARQAGIETPIGNHTFRATGITAYLKNQGTLEKAAQIANHASTRTTQLYDRRANEVSLDEVERISI